MSENLISARCEPRLRKVVLLLVFPVSILLSWRRRRSAENRLGALPDHMLKDIAVSRGEIPFIASQDCEWIRFR
jgi:uncharacterized protein YjiS (DUF1127 family)